MLRETDVRRLHWADKTMSVLRQTQLEACEKRLTSLPDKTIFDLENDLHAEVIWQCSYGAQENPLCITLHTIRQLRADVLAALSAEAALLSFDEHQLVERIITLEGSAELLDWQEISAAESLVRRLWCSISRQKDGRIIVRMPEPLLTPLTLTISSRTHQEIRERLMQHETILRSLLHVAGLMHVDTPMYHLMAEVLQDTYAADPLLALRYLRASYDYTYDCSGDLLLLHPGLADPEHLLRLQPEQIEVPPEMNDNIMRIAVNGMLPEEQPLFESLCGLLDGATRPELTPEDAVEDLLILAKQDVPLAEMQEVLSSLLTVQPTQQMRQAVGLLHAFTPRWGMMHLAQAQ